MKMNIIIWCSVSSRLWEEETCHLRPLLMLTMMLQQFNQPYICHCPVLMLIVIPHQFNQPYLRRLLMLTLILHRINTTCLLHLLMCLIGNI
ncbi:hypothetical protein TSUD_282890 [Trifolium subterraneum]|uniref:Uncharacterized protein n=1 Tax=Trifolium subterraneum TaxID=3900 RepID=A0A2Z6PQJ8_TRISU|nr:hypothetical protein TSUD_282890 [Trifolium subterraneum]